MQEKRTLQELDGRIEIIKGMIGCKRRGPSDGELDGRMEIIKGHDRMQEKRTLQELDRWTDRDN